MNKTILHAVYWSALVLLASCNVAQDKNKESFTSGQLRLGVDESYSLMMDSQVFTYTSLNKYAKIEATYKPEADIINDLLHDSIQSAVIGRELNAEEMAFFKSKNRVPESILIAHDGVALIIHPEILDSVITMQQLQDIFQGKDSLWSQIYPQSNRGKIQVVFDNQKSCNARTLKEKFNIDEFPAWCFSQRSNEEVIQYVNQNKNAMGVISLSWISDAEDPTCMKYRSMIRPMGIVDPTNAVKPELARRPYQAYVFDTTYPLRRDVFYIRAGQRGTLGTGFANHLIGEKGQLIIHKTGMVAARTPNRTVKIVN
ncbi:MAG: substrate-binding domain-containing protein [Flavobacteriales bacterium]|nr:substrate-binding domain-containing protein [Flavobacteriales bacterium]